MRMLRDNMLVKKLTKEKTGKIILPPGSMEDDWCRGLVKAVGPGIMEDGKRIKPDIKEGDVIVYPPMPGGASYPCISVDEEEYIMFNDRFVWAVEE